MQMHIKTLFALSALALMGGSAQAVTISLTSVDQLDFTNVVKAYDFSSTNSINSFGSTFNIGGVTFTRYRWNQASPNNTFDGLTVTGGLVIDNQNSGAATITLGGTATDRTNLTRLLQVWNIGAQGTASANHMNLSVALANGTYKVQYLVGGVSARRNTLLDVDNNVTLGSFTTGSPGTSNVLITGDVVVADGTLNLRLLDGPGSGDNRRVISGLIINAVPEPTSFAILAFGMISLSLFRYKRN